MVPPEGHVRQGPFEELTDTWWDESGIMHGLGELLDPVRVPFITGSLAAELGAGSHHVLDLGAGGGRLSTQLADRGCSVTALDPSWRALREGRDHSDGLPIRFVAGEGEQLPFADASFDAVVCMEVLEHVEDPGAVVAEAGRLLRLGGLFVYSGPNRTLTSGLGLVLMAQHLLGVVPRGTHRWRRLLRPAEVDALMRSSGIEPLRLVGVGPVRRRVPAAARAIAGLLLNRLTHAEAARRIALTTTQSTRLAYQGYGVRRSWKAGIAEAAAGATSPSVPSCR